MPALLMYHPCNHRLRPRAVVPSGHAGDEVTPENYQQVFLRIIVRSVPSTGEVTLTSLACVMECLSVCIRTVQGLLVRPPHSRGRKVHHWGLITVEPGECLDGVSVSSN